MLSRSLLCFPSGICEDYSILAPAAPCFEFSRRGSVQFSKTGFNSKLGQGLGRAQGSVELGSCPPQTTDAA